MKCVLYTHLLSLFLQINMPVFEIFGAQGKVVFIEWFVISMHDT